MNKTTAFLALPPFLFLLFAGAGCGSEASIGNAQWVRDVELFGLSYQSRPILVADLEGNIYLIGSTRAYRFDATGKEHRIRRSDPSTQSALTRARDHQAKASALSVSGSVLIKRDPLGALVWQAPLGELGIVWQDIALDDQGSVYVVGTQGVGGGAFSSAPYSLVRKYDQSGGLVWDLALRSEDPDRGPAAVRIAVDTAERVYIAGVRYESIEDSPFGIWADRGTFVARIEVPNQ